MITSPSHALELLGGVKVVSDKLKRPYTTVASWAARQSIPTECWSQLVEMAKERDLDGFTYEALVQAHGASGERPSRKPRAA